ncbi:MAG: L-aspartate oxidase [Lentisphaeria bacterium]|nr:L-aspartate oxidase [Lentisphaeria bacterium]
MDNYKFDHLVIGSGLSGLTTALKLAEAGEKVAVFSKLSPDIGSTKCAQGGIACVTAEGDSFNEHVFDTLNAGGRLCNEIAVRKIVEGGPEAIAELVERGAHFTTRGEVGKSNNVNEFDLGREGGHHKRRILHAGDITGEEIERIMLHCASTNPNITIFDHNVVIDLIVSARMEIPGPNRCYGLYTLDIRSGKVNTFLGLSTTIACGGVGKVYLYTSNPDIACGAGVAMGYRAGAQIANMEFIQFHPTILHHPTIRSFLISEAVRGEGAVLKCYDHGELKEFMDKYHPMKSLAPRDVVARAIDSEMKRTGEDCVYLDIRHVPEETLKLRFPNIFAKCLEAGINMAKDLIPVVPAAHYSCGGVKTDTNGFTGIEGLYAVGESACTGLHGANRLASNSLLEALVIPRYAAKHIMENKASLLDGRWTGPSPSWHCGNAVDSDEQVIIAHNWEDIRRFMWDYVGIVRTQKRLERAKARIEMIRQEIDKYYWDFLVTADLLELRNIATVAELIIDSSMQRHESRGLHYNADYPELDPALDFQDTIIQRNFKYYD